MTNYDIDMKELVEMQDLFVQKSQLKTY